MQKTDNILVIGANSAITTAVAREFAAQGASLFLAARNYQRVSAVADDLRVRGAKAVTCQNFEANHNALHANLLEAAWQQLGEVDVLLIAHGTLSDQAACENDVDLCLQEIHTNALSVVSLLTLAAPRMQAQGHGVLAAVSSVAGDRGRASNYVYGSAKALVTAFMSGLRQRLAPAGIPVVCIKPGFIDTPMTAAIANKGLLWSTPKAIAPRIVRALQRGTPEVYVPGFWYLIMLIVRHLPAALFNRLRL